MSWTHRMHRNIFGLGLSTLLAAAAGCGSSGSDQNPAGRGGVGGSGGTGGSGGVAGSTAGVGGDGVGGQTPVGGAGGNGFGGTGSSGTGGEAGAGGAGGMNGDAGVPMGGSPDAGMDMPEPAVQCDASNVSPGNSEVEIMHDGEQRNFLLHVPPSYDGSEPVPLVVEMHGLTSRASAQAGLSGWREKGDEEGFIVVHPNGLDNSWNGGELCCGTSQSRGVDDEGFIRAVVDYMKQEACIDPQRVYATGLSNGGAMSHLLACNAADVFAATAPVSMGNGTDPCNPSRPISVAMFRGTQDALVGYNGGAFPSAAADFDQWSQLNGCTGEPETAHDICEVYKECEAGVEVMLCTIEAGHVPYDAASQQGAPIPDVTWEMFQRQTLP